MRMLLLAIAALVSFPVANSHAQSWPSRSIRLVVGFAPGGTADVIARRLQAPLQAALGQSVVVENRTGASGATAAVEVARSASDGHTLGVVVSTHASLPVLREQSPFDPIKDFSPIVLVGQIPLVLVVHPSVPAKDLGELIAMAKRAPGQLNYATPGIGLSHHFAGELLKLRAGVDIAHVPYRGAAPALNDVIGGQVQMTFAAPPAVAGFIEAGRVRPLAITGSARSPALPDVPTIAELGFPGFEVTEWYGVVGPAGLPPPVVQRLNTSINELFASSDQQGWLKQNAVERRYRTAEEFASFIQSEIEKLRTIAREANIKAE